MDVENNKNQSKSKVKKYIKRILLGLILFVTVFLITVSIIAVVCENKIAHIVLEKIYEESKVEITHRSVSFSLIRKFPMAALQINDIDVDASRGEEKLLVAQSVYLKFNIIDILKGQYVIRKIDINDASLSLCVDKNGVSNWDIFRKEDTTSQQVALKLDNITLSHVHVTYQGVAQKLFVATQVKKLSAKGDFSQNVSTLYLSASVEVDSLCVSEKTYLKDQPIVIHANLYMNPETKEYQIQNGDFNLDFIRFTASSKLSYNGKTYPIEANIKIENADIEQIMQKLPENVYSSANVLKPSGRLNGKIQITGILGGKKQELSIKGNINGKDISIENVENNISLSKGNFAGSFSMQLPDLKKSLNVQIDNFASKLQSGYIKGKATLNNLSAPTVDLEVNAKVNLEDWHNFIPKNYISQTSGNASLNLQFTNTFTSLDSLSKRDFKNSTIKGMMVFDRVLLQMKENEEAFEDLNGELEFNNQVVNARKLKGKFKGNQFVLNGTIENVYPYLFLEGEHLHINADLLTPHLDVNRLLKKSTAPATTRKQEDEMHLMLPDYINFDLAFKADKITYDHFEAQQTSGKAILKNKQLSLNNFQMNACQGEISGSGSIAQNNSQNFSLHCNVQLETLNISKLFYSLNNFNQDALTDKNINGSLSGNVDLSLNLQNNMEIIPQSVKATIYLNMSNGQLVNFAPLRSLSKFIELSELQNINFSTIENVITIEKSTIVIPAMDIKNSALNLNVSGKQTFKGEINYSLKVLLKEVLSKKFRMKRMQQEDFGEVIDDQSGNTMVHVQTTGTLQNPIFKWNLKSTKKEIKEQIEEQKTAIRKAAEEQNPNAAKAKQADKELNNHNRKNSEIEVDENW